MVELDASRVGLAKNSSRSGKTTAPPPAEAPSDFFATARKASTDAALQLAAGVLRFGLDLSPWPHVAYVLLRVGVGFGEFMSFQAARDFSSLLLGELRPEDLVSQGVANDEARRRTVLRNWILERLANLISFAVFSGVIMPHIVLILYMAATIATQCFDLISGMSITDAFREFLVSLFMNHWDDACNVPLGVLSRLFWIVLLVRLSIFYIWCLGALVTARCSCECSFLASALFYLIKSPAVALAVAFELLWPILTFVCICISSATGECSEELQLGCSLLLAPYFGQVLYIIFQCMKPVLYRTGIIPDPGNLTRGFQHISFRPEDFVEDEGGYPKSCSICLVDFSADDTDIVITPCSGQRHIFHSACLATWFRTAQTCPLCRTALGGGAGWWRWCRRGR
ncbi:ATL28 [Symbiodinium sp. KB8]|nr:ATL28 [Symbiodinium sp. KB8]